MAQFPRNSVTALEGKGKLEEVSKNWNNLPSILSMRLYEWIAALTHPKTGAFPNGISPRQLDRLAQNQITAASKELGQELKPIWKSNNHLGVMLWNEVKAGRVVRLHKACYVGNFHIKPGGPGNPRSNAVKKAVINVTESLRSERLSSTSKVCSQAFDTAKPMLASPVLEHKPSAHVDDKRPKQEPKCFVCKNDLNIVGGIGTLKCVECAYQTHVLCAYATGTVPANLLKRQPSAVSNWRCYDCKRCHLCGKKDDSSDGLLLCDGCDSGEHMGCQRPALNEVPPAPWFCSLCHIPTTQPSTTPPPPAASAVASTPPVLTVATADDPRVTEASPFETSALIIDEPVNAETTTKAASPVTVINTAPSPDCSSIQSDQDSSAQHQTTTSPPTWPTAVKTASPPLSDEMPEVNQKQARRGSEGSDSSSIPTNVEEPKPIRTRLGKREGDGEWAIEEQDPSSPPRRRRRFKHVDSPTHFDLPKKVARSDSASSPENVTTFDLGSRKSRKDKDESELLPYMSEDLPLLNEDDARSVRGAKLWTVEDTAAFIEKMGYPDSAKAFRREEIDGAALLLLRRQDVLLNLGLKLGPALRTYKFVRYIQSTVRSA